MDNNHKQSIAMPIKSRIRTVPHYPKSGVMFRDITTLLKDATGLQLTVNSLADHYRNQAIDRVAGIEARGFILGAAVAYELGLGFIPVRKKGKLPAEVVGQDYALEYGSDRIEIHTDAIAPGESILLIDDLIATGGTAAAACALIQSMGGVVHGCGFVIDLPDLGGRQLLEQLGHSVFSLCEFEGD
jgi:adenine phosphoribosyltransferase